MDLNATIDIIIKDLNEVRDIIDDLKKYPDVPELQVELAKAKCKSASEVIALLKSLQIKSPSSSERPVIKERIVTEKLPEKPKKQIITAEKEVKEAVSKEVPEVIPDEVEPVAVSIKKPAEQAIIADQFSNRPESFNEKLGSLKHEDDVLEILKTQPLSSLNEAIGINDKFLFIREIFNGNAESYNQAIQKLESVNNLSDAMSVIMSHAGENTGNEAVKQLVDLIKRKLLAHE